LYVARLLKRVYMVTYDGSRLGFEMKNKAGWGDVRLVE
jgi:hypothetical protein